MFQSTHPRGVRRKATGRLRSLHPFQSTHPRGVRPAGRSRSGWWPCSFNPRTRVGCDLHGVWRAAEHRPVSIHAPAWGATSRPLPAMAPNASFNPRTRVGCDLRDREGRQAVGLVSIHAPAWGATAPARAVGLGDLPVSIHAPAWGATADGLAFRRAFPGFNPRTRVGCDLLRISMILGLKVFQSTHPRGVRLLQVTSPKRLPRSFNPRTRVGCDPKASPTTFPTKSFQSTHPRGVRRPYRPGCGQ